jgi:hypothetical protein
MTRIFICILCAALFLGMLTSFAGAFDPAKGIFKPQLTPSSPDPILALPTKTEAAGIVQKRGVTTYMYGTHILSGSKIYALKSDTIKLDRYLGKAVMVSGRLVPGYPMSGGPEFLDVDMVRD